MHSATRNRKTQCKMTLAQKMTGISVYTIKYLRLGIPFLSVASSISWTPRRLCSQKTPVTPDNPKAKQPMYYPTDKAVLNACTPRRERVETHIACSKDCRPLYICQHDDRKMRISPSLTKFGHVGVASGIGSVARLYQGQCFYFLGLFVIAL